MHNINETRKHTHTHIYIYYTVYIIYSAGFWTTIYIDHETMFGFHGVPCGSRKTYPTPCEEGWGILMHLGRFGLKKQSQLSKLPIIIITHIIHISHFWGEHHQLSWQFIRKNSTSPKPLFPNPSPPVVEGRLTSAPCDTPPPGGPSGAAVPGRRVCSASTSSQAPDVMACASCAAWRRWSWKWRFWDWLDHWVSWEWDQCGICIHLHLYFREWYIYNNNTYIYIII